MLCLVRKKGQFVKIGDDISVKVLEIQENRVKLGFIGPPEMRIDRSEVRELRNRMAAGEPLHGIETDMDLADNKAKVTRTIPGASLPPKQRDKEMNHA